MQISLQELKLLGYKKIYNMYLRDRNNRESFLNGIRYLDRKFYSMEITAYGLLNRYRIISNIKPEGVMRGYSLFAYSLEPMIGVDDPSLSAKRKCRNIWESMWSNLQKVSRLEGYELDLMDKIGLKIVFIYASYCYRYENKGLNKLCNDIRLNDNEFRMVTSLMGFYNALLTWTVLTQQESNLSKNSMNVNDAMYLLVEDSNKFMEKLSNIC